MIYISLPIISLVYIVSFIMFYYSKKRINLFENKYVIVMMAVNVFGLIFELGCYAVLGFFKNQDTFMGMFVLKTYIVYILVFNWLLNAYIFYLTCNKRHNDDFDKKKYFLKVLQLSFPLLLFLISITCFAPLYYYAEFPKYYTYGLATYSIVFCFIFLLPFWFIKCIISLLNKNNIHSSHTYIIMLVILLCASSGLATQFIDKSVQIVTTVHSFVLIIIFLNIENPDVAMLKKLDIARNQADKANKAKTDFLSSMSHEIRTPLNAIVGFSDCVMEADSLEEAKENAKDIVDASGTLLEIVNGILDISKIEAGKLDLSYSSYNAFNTFDDLAKLVGPKMREKGLDFSHYIAPDLPEYLYGDELNVKKIVTNLLSNACKYTDKGYVRYEVNCVNIDDYSRLIISVEDSGHGIKKQSIEKLFTNFQRLDDYKNSTIEGTGLGLAITKQLTELMGGKIIVHSVYGTGSKFTVVLNQKISNEKTVDNNEDDKEIDLKDIKILIVDDNELNIKVASKLLEKYNANCIKTCESGIECLDIINNGDVFDIILLDDMMPKMSGVETLSELRKIDGFNTPVVALTANAISGMREKYLTDGFDGYLAKPIEKNELIKVLNELIFKSSNDKDADVKNENNENNTPAIIPVDDSIEKELDGKLDFTYNASVMDNLDTTNPIKVIPVVDIDANLVKEKYDESYLEENGVNLKYALDLLGDMEIYDSTLGDFLEEVEDKWNRIVEYKNSSDMKNYAIEVHSLKSDSKYLGLMDLADVSYQHEIKSKENDVEYVNNHFSELENEYNRILEVIKKYNNSKKMLN